MTDDLGTKLKRLAAVMGYDQMTVADKGDGTYIVHYPKHRHRFLIPEMEKLGFDLSKIEMRGKLRVRPA